MSKSRSVPGFACFRQNAGYTMVELIVTMMVVSIMAVVALPRLTSSNFDDVVFQDQALTALQFARRTAVSARRHVCVTIAADSLSLAMDPRLPETVGSSVPNCTITPLTLPDGKTSVTPRKASLQMSPTGSFSFGPRGNASSGTPATLTVAGRDFQIVQESGYVY